VVDAGRAGARELGSQFLDEAQGRILLARGASAEAASVLQAVAREAADRGYRLVEWRARILAAEARAADGFAEEAEGDLAAVAVDAHAGSAVLIRDAARAAAGRLGLTLPELAELPSTEDGAAPELVGAGERLVTSMFADVRGYSALAAAATPPDLADRVGTLHRWAAAEVGRHHGIVDKFAGDAVMATFNATGARIDHATHALEAALGLCGKAALLDLGVGIGIAVGPAVVARTVAGANVSVLGRTTNLAARLQAAAGAGEIVLSAEAFVRVADWLAERGLEAVPQRLELKGFAGPQEAWRLRS
jgi:adenylate cyclase